jgi:hypothetical protein
VALGCAANPSCDTTAPSPLDSAEAHTDREQAIDLSEGDILPFRYQMEEV